MEKEYPFASLMLEVGKSFGEVAGLEC